MQSQPALEFLLPHLDDAWQRVQDWLAGLSEAEFQWQPGDNVWHLEEHDGYGRIPYSWKPPVPAPLPTIAWHMAHLATSLVITVDHAFGERKLKLADLRLPLHAAEMADYLADCHSGLVKAVAGLSDADLPQLRWTEWGEQRTTAAIVGSAILHEVEHGAQITAVRTLYWRWPREEK